MIPLDRAGPIAKVALSLLVVLAFFGCIAALIGLTVRGKELLPGIKEVLLVLIGVLAGAFKDVIGYWMGSSHSSSRKTELASGRPE